MEKATDRMKLLGNIFWSLLSGGLILLGNTPLLAQSNSLPTLVSHEPMQYPPIGRAAHVEGDVTVAFTIDELGIPANIVAKSGPEMLRATALKAVKEWHFSPTGSQTVALEAVFQFRLAPPAEGYNETGPAKTAVELHSLNNVKVIGIATTGLDRDKCPSDLGRQPPETKAPSDYVELFRGPCVGTCPAYKVRVYRNGMVLWDGSGYVALKAHAEALMPATDAETLLDSFETGAFWELCGAYSKSVTDSETTGISVHIGSRAKEISVYADSAPSLYHDLTMEVDRIANTHQWRHGDPLTEPLTNIDLDSYYPKPGVTALMIASASAKESDLKRLIENGANINDADASGWSSLMFAGLASSSQGTKILLNAGAKPDYQSPQGDTALMVSALQGMLEQDLLGSGANINLQNRKGVTVLMLLANRAETDEIKLALKAGANVSLRDSRGRTALDYLHLANCGQSAVPREEWMTSTYSKCTALDKKDFLSSETLLKRAMHK